MNEGDLIGTTDATVWAREFMRLFRDYPERIDEELMVGWFANALETGANGYRRAMFDVQAQLRQVEGSAR